MRGSKKLEAHSMARTFFLVQVGNTHKMVIFMHRTSC